MFFAVDTDKLALIERTISTAMVTEFDLDLSALALDMTNFATFIDSANDKATCSNAATPS